MSVGGVDGLGPGHFADEQLGIVDLDGKDAEGAQADEAELGILEADRLLGAPFQVQEGLQVDEIDLGLERGLEAVGQGEQPGQQGDVHGRQDMAAGLEGVQGLAVAEKDRGLVLLDDQLRPELDVARALFGDAVRNLLSRLVEVLDDLEFHLLSPLSYPFSRAVLCSNRPSICSSLSRSGSSPDGSRGAAASFLNSSLKATAASAIFASSSYTASNSASLILIRSKKPL